MKSQVPLAIATLVLSLADCSKSEPAKVDTAEVISNVGPPRGNIVANTSSPATLTVTSTAFSPNGSMPVKYTCEGPGVSPPVELGGIPGGAKSIVLIVEDPDAPDPAKPTRIVSHWVTYNIPPNTSSLAENASKSGLPAGAEQGLNERNAVGYMGPCPPIGRHRYFFKAFALDTVLTGLNKPKKSDVEAAMKGHVVGSGELVGTYQKTKK
ncbi:MAG: YbhB/YbcL family Raf kinase inhibitor-like protein [Gemmatimonadaceae bacterium]